MTDEEMQNCLRQLTFHKRRKIARNTAKNTTKVMTNADHTTTGTKKVNDIKFFLYMLKFSFRRDGNTPLLYFSDVSMALGIKIMAIPRRATMLIATAIHIEKFTLNRDKNISTVEKKSCILL